MTERIRYDITEGPDVNTWEKALEERGRCVVFQVSYPEKRSIKVRLTLVKSPSVIPSGPDQWWDFQGESQTPDLPGSCEGSYNPHRHYGEVVIQIQ